MKRTETEFLTSDGLALFSRSWLPDGDPELRGIVCIAHGLGEHADRYEHVAEELTGAGFAVVAADHRGHGHSGGLRGHTESFDDYVADLLAFARSQQGELGASLPLYLLGHSMGGLITVKALQSGTDLPLAGAIISNPCLGVAVQAPKVKVALAKGLSKLLPKLRLDNELNTPDLCRDQAVIDAYEADPLVHRKISARWYTALLEAMENANERSEAVSVPTLWLLSGKDVICDTQLATSFAASLPSHSTEQLRFPEAYHEAHNGPDKSKVLAGVVSWLDRQVSS